MTTRFAGSRSLDERRRRRLATESDTDPVPGKSAAAGASDPSRATLDFPDDPGPAPRSEDRVDFPIHKLISQNRAKLWCLGLALAALTAGTVGWGHAARDRLTESSLQSVLSFEAAHRSAGFLVEVQLLLSSQFAWLIWWRRSRSRGDFGGTYRIWAWASAVFFLAAAGHAVQAQRAFAEAVQWALKFELGRWSPLCWLIPAAGVGHALFSGLQHDMRGCRSSRILLWISFLCFAALGVVHVGGESLLPEGTLTTKSALLLSGTLTLFQSLLLHVRFVLYESPEPPEPLPGRVRLALRRLGALWRERRELRRLRNDERRLQRRQAAAEKRAKAEAIKQERATRAASPEKPKPVSKRSRASTSAEVTGAESDVSPPAPKAAKPRKPARKSAKVSTPTPKVTESSNEPNQPEVSDSQSAAPEPAPPRQTAPVRQPPAPKGHPVGESKPPSIANSKENGDDGDSPLRIDPADGPPSMKGLSKRERRKMKQAWREAQRAG